MVLVGKGMIVKFHALFFWYFFIMLSWELLGIPFKRLGFLGIKPNRKNPFFWDFLAIPGWVFIARTWEGERWKLRTFVLCVFGQAFKAWLRGRRFARNRERGFSKRQLIGAVMFLVKIVFVCGVCFLYVFLFTLSMNMLDVLWCCFLKIVYRSN